MTILSFPSATLLTHFKASLLMLVPRKGPGGILILGDALSQQDSLSRSN